MANGIIIQRKNSSESISETNEKVDNCCGYLFISIF